MVFRDKSYYNTTNFDIIPFDYNIMKDITSGYSAQKLLTSILKLLDFEVDGFNKLSINNITSSEILYFKHACGIDITNYLQYSLMKSDMRFIVINDDNGEIVFDHFFKLDFTIKSNLDNNKVNYISTFVISSYLKKADSLIYTLFIYILESKLERYLSNIGVNYNKAQGNDHIINVLYPNVNDAFFILYYTISIFKGLDKIFDLKYTDYDNIPVLMINDLPLDLNKKIYDYAISSGDSIQSEFIDLADEIINEICKWY